MPTFQILFVGRFVRLHFSFDAQEFLSFGGDLIFWGIHDYKIPEADSQHARTLFQSDLNFVSTRPLNSILIFGGDLNRMREGEIRYYIDPVDQANSMVNSSLHAAKSSLEINAWNTFLSQLIEIETSPHSHYSKA